VLTKSIIGFHAAATPPSGALAIDGNASIRRVICLGCWIMVLELLGCVDTVAILHCQADRRLPAIRRTAAIDIASGHLHGANKRCRRCVDRFPDSPHFSAHCLDHFADCHGLPVLCTPMLWDVSSDRENYRETRHDADIYAIMLPVGVQCRCAPSPVPKYSYPKVARFVFDCHGSS